MRDFNRLIFGFKKGSSVQFTFDNLTKKKVVLLIIAALIALVAVLVVWIFIFKSSQQKISTPKSSQGTQNPVKNLPQTNPFEVKTNPFKDIKTNPFR